MYSGAELSFHGIKIRFTFGFFAVWAILIMCGSGKAAEITLISCLLHEAGHIIAMRLMKIKVRRLIFYSGGIMLTSSPPIECTGSLEEIIILSAGCIVNICVAAAAFSLGNRLWGLINLALALFNMLPFSALDGGRIIRAAAVRMFPAADIDGAGRVCDIVLGIAAAAFFMSKGNVNFTLPLTLGMIILESLTEK